ncbi:hypothetical protein MTO98_03680 [Mucilaginibacter sp. SMC90]|uniref:hypothetical protein n=1 Tax=Mucilaginibacter sp. SMC90 TaxID=2929803 RepID=UPI001FB24858|nr:hypothetical protein [Mucilaginibacter sp. SMC90]UOE50170.1 hypothetical protein MTO98_03680 [Mucilaginibacter sp. SMC90]
MKYIIELRRIRDFGEIINDTFTFLKQNFKPLFSSLFVICGFFVLVGTVTTAFSQISIYDSAASTSSADYNSGLKVGLGIITNGLVTILSQFFIYLTTLCFVAVYLEKKGEKPTPQDVWNYFKHYFFRSLGSAFLLLLLACLGFVFCIIPGIYLVTVFYLVLPIMVMENANFNYSFNKCFKLIKDYWWTVFGIMFVCSLIVSVCSSIATIPLTLVASLRLFVSMKYVSWPVMIFFSMLQNILMLTYAIPTIAIALCYFSLEERKDGTGILERIEAFGTHTDKADDLPAEQY